MVNLGYFFNRLTGKDVRSFSSMLDIDNEVARLHDHAPRVRRHESSVVAEHGNVFPVVDRSWGDALDRELECELARMSRYGNDESRSN